MTDNTSPLQKAAEELPASLTVTRQLIQDLDDLVDENGSIPVYGSLSPVLGAVMALEVELRRVYRILGITESFDPATPEGEFDPKSGLFKPDSSI
jgi:hypothetical protein